MSQLLLPSVKQKKVLFSFCFSQPIYHVLMHRIAALFVAYFSYQKRIKMKALTFKNSQKCGQTEI